MISIESLRRNVRAVTPSEALEHLNAFSKNSGEDFRAPLIELHLVSGTTIRGYLVDAGGDREHRCYLIAREPHNPVDDAADLIYVYGVRIEALTVINLEDYPGAMPSLK